MIFSRINHKFDYSILFNITNIPSMSKAPFDSFQKYADIKEMNQYYKVLYDPNDKNGQEKKDLIEKCYFEFSPGIN